MGRVEAATVETTGETSNSNGSEIVRQLDNVAVDKSNRPEAVSPDQVIHP